MDINLSRFCESNPSQAWAEYYGRFAGYKAPKRSYEPDRAEDFERARHELGIQRV